MHLGVWQKTAVFATAAVVGMTGLFWFILHDLIDDEPGGAARVLLMLHGISSYAMLVVIGSLLPRHVRLGWIRRRNIVTGVTTTAAMAGLAVTGLALYYGDEDLHLAARWLHVIVGLGCFALFPAHAFLAARLPRSNPSSPAGDGATPARELAAGSSRAAPVSRAQHPQSASPALARSDPYAYWPHPMRPERSRASREDQP